MTGLTNRFDDRLEPLGIAASVFLVVIALGTVAGMPWATNSSVVVSVMQLLGVVGLLAISVGLVWLVRLE